jgi:hypothetical protein
MAFVLTLFLKESKLRPVSPFLRCRSGLWAEMFYPVIHPLVDKTNRPSSLFQGSDDHQWHCGNFVVSCGVPLSIDRERSIVARLNNPRRDGSKHQ